MLPPNGFAVTCFGGEIADEVAGLLLAEEQAADVRGIALELLGDARVVDDRELRVRERLGDRRDRVGHQEADADDQVVALPCRSGQVRDVVAARLRDEDAALDAELRLRLVETLVGEEVERAVVETADVGHERDLERGLRRCGRRRRRGSRSCRSSRTGGAGAGDDERHDGYERCRDEQHERACLHIPSLGITTTARLGRLITPQVGAERKILTFAAGGRAYEAVTKRSSSASSTSTRRGFEPS